MRRRHLWCMSSFLAGLSLYMEGYSQKNAPRSTANAEGNEMEMEVRGGGDASKVWWEEKGMVMRHSTAMQRTRSRIHSPL